LLGFGGIPITRRNFEDAVNVVRHALDLGVTYIDTANGYLDSEEKIGRAIVGRRHQLVISSKSHATTKQGILQHIELSLRRLKTDYIDLYQCHHVSKPDQWEAVSGPNGALEGLHLAREQGKIRHIGVTSHSLSVTVTVLESGAFETVMVPFNMIAREAEDEVFPLARQRDIGFIAMKPMAGGEFTEAELPIRWLCRYPDANILVGFENEQEVEEVYELVEAARPLDEAEQQEVERLQAETGRLFCRRCGYCQPCPAGIPITNAMVFQSFIRRFGPGTAAERFGAGLEKIRDCEDCGQCEEKCPYHLPIRERIAHTLEVYQSIVAGEYDGDDSQAR